MKQFLKILKILLFFLLSLPLLYLFIAVIGFLIPVNSTSQIEDPAYQIFLVSNGVHVDIAVPVKTEIMDWSAIVKPEHIPANVENYNYLSLGWGDLGFYKTTPEWEDLKFQTAFTALFLNSPAAIQATFYADLYEDEQTIAVKLNEDQFRKLSSYLLNSFKLTDAGIANPIPNLHYGRTDAFYHAPGSFSLFKTCNTWANNGLKVAGLEASLWTPFEEGIFLRYR